MEREDIRMKDIRESIAVRKPLSMDDMSDWLLRAITGGDIKGYAEKVRAREEDGGRAVREHTGTAGGYAEP